MGTHKSCSPPPKGWENLNNLSLYDPWAKNGLYIFKKAVSKQKTNKVTRQETVYDPAMSKTFARLPFTKNLADLWCSILNLHKQKWWSLLQHFNSLLTYGWWKVLNYSYIPQISWYKWHVLYKSVILHPNKYLGSRLLSVMPNKPIVIILAFVYGCACT